MSLYYGRQGSKIVATARGYMLEQPLEELSGKFLVNIRPEQTRRNCQSLFAKGGSGRCEYCTASAL